MFTNATRDVDRWHLADSLAELDRSIRDAATVDVRTGEPGFLVDQLRRPVSKRAELIGP